MTRASKVSTSAIAAALESDHQSGRLQQSKVIAYRPLLTALTVPLVPEAPTALQLRPRAWAGTQLMSRCGPVGVALRHAIKILAPRHADRRFKAAGAARAKKTPH